MEYVDVIIQFVNGCGFPIVAFFAMFYMIMQDRKSRSEERQKWTEAINKNTEVLTELKTHLKGGTANVSNG